jgi:hypothetical protein
MASSVDPIPSNATPVAEPYLLISYKNFNKNELTSAGYEIDFYSNGYAVATYHTKWQGESDGQSYSTKLIPLSMKAALEREVNGETRKAWEPSLGAAVQAWLAESPPTTNESWTLVDPGSTVR